MLTFIVKLVFVPAHSNSNLAPRTRFEITSRTNTLHLQTQARTTLCHGPSTLRTWCRLSGVRRAKRHNGRKWTSEPGLGSHSTLPAKRRRGGETLANCFRQLSSRSCLVLSNRKLLQRRFPFAISGSAEKQRD